MSASEYIKSIIKAQGALTVAQFMAIALSDSKYGYYMTKEPFGSKGDFTTSPEISQIFGELIGAWSASVWQTMNTPDDITIVELGPGRGTLMKDFLRGTKSVLGFHDSASVHLVEISPVLEKTQRHNLEEYGSKINWHPMFSEIPKKPAIIIANEFFDALPIHQFVKTKNGWREKMLDLDKSGNLQFSLSRTETINCASIPHEFRDAPIDSVYESCPAAKIITEEIAEHIKHNGGAALFIDYGYNQNPLKDSLQSVKNHQFNDILQHIGESDITAYVNFSEIAQIAKDSGLNIYGPIDQGDFLKKIGIDLRAEILMKKSTGEVKKDIMSQVKRLTDKEQMGKIFKCLSIANKNTLPPTGF